MRLAALLGALLFSLHAAPCQSAQQEAEQKQETPTVEQGAMPEALQRKERSEAVLQAEGVPINKFLPAIETEGEAKVPAKEEVAYRALALLVVAVKGEGLEQATVERVVKDYELDGHFTPKELAFIHNPSPSQRDRFQFSWRYEAAWTLLWALGYVEKLEKPAGICNVRRAVELMKARSARQFVADAKLRSTTEILDQADRIYRYHWAVVDARVNGKGAPAELQSGVTQERHYALNWLIGYMDQQWDDISTDT